MLLVFYVFIPLFNQQFYSFWEPDKKIQIQIFQTCETFTGSENYPGTPKMRINFGLFFHILIAKSKEHYRTSTIAIL